MTATTRPDLAAGGLDRVPPGRPAMTATAHEERLAFDAWVRDRRPSLLRAAVAITRDRESAEDLLQTTLTKVFLSWDDVRDQGALDGYVRRVMANTQSSWWRRGWRPRETAVADVADVADALASGTDGFAVVEAREDLTPLLRALPPKQQYAVVLPYLEERSVAETAQLLGIPPGAVKSQTSRAIATMRRTVRPVTAAA
jgi:RNA polymerase sigma-70 factor (sigma-E family)